MQGHASIGLRELVKRSQETTKWETKPRVEKPSPQPGEGRRPRPRCSGTAAAEAAEPQCKAWVPASRPRGPVRRPPQRSPAQPRAARAAGRHEAAPLSAPSRSAEHRRHGASSSCRRARPSPRHGPGLHSAPGPRGPPPSPCALTGSCVHPGAGGASRQSVSPRSRGR